MLSTLFNYLKNRFYSFSLKTKIMLFFGLLFILFLSVTFFIFNKIHSESVMGKAVTLSRYNLESSAIHIQTYLDLIDSFYSLIVSEERVLECLDYAGDRRSAEYKENARAVSEYLTRLKDNISEFHSIYLMNFSEDISLPGATPEESVLLKMGYEGEYEKMVKGRNNDLYIFRRVLDFPGYCLVFQISMETLTEAYMASQGSNNSVVAIYNEASRLVWGDSELLSSEENLFSATRGADLYQNSFVNIAGHGYILSLLRVRNWQIISLLPLAVVKVDMYDIRYLMIAMVLINLFIVILGPSVLAKRIVRPIDCLTESMCHSEEGSFEELSFTTSINEFTRLRDGYNHMIREIQRLLERVVEEQRIKRHTELNAFQAQIKPHFLYNTIDAVNSLALMGKNREVYKLMTALGSYYRTSLNRGSDIISLKDEVAMVRNYLSILRTRYGNIFTVEFDIDEQSEQLKILKLVLQPIVENSLYHGIKPKGEPGSIIIRTEREKDRVHIIVEDDGVGMSEEEIESLLKKAYTTEANSSFGVRGTVQRLRLFYGRDDVFHMISEKNAGTKTIITIPFGEDV